MEGRNLNAAPAAVSGVMFRRRVAAVNRSGRRTMGIILLGMALLVGGMFAWLQYLIAQHPHHRVPVPPSHGGPADPTNYIMLVLVLIAAVYLLASREYERLYISPQGVRYVSWLSGPLRFLQSLYPSWELSWDELKDIRLTRLAQGRGIQFWRYELVPRQGKVRRLPAGFWRLAGKDDDIPLTLFQNMKRDPTVIQAALSQTGLFRLLDLTLRARKSQFPHALIESR
ncbi:MAG TPA: hypothetical protein VGT42_03345 [Gammaproteobacteria bacterium]|nr:hypothetical protein [Gammaproteobacteria bacterium]